MSTCEPYFTWRCLRCDTCHWEPKHGFSNRAELFCDKCSALRWHQTERFFERIPVLTTQEDLVAEFTETARREIEHAKNRQIDWEEAERWMGYVGAIYGWE